MLHTGTFLGDRDCRNSGQGHPKNFPSTPSLTSSAVKELQNKLYNNTCHMQIYISPLSEVCNISCNITFYMQPVSTKVYNMNIYNKIFQPYILQHKNFPNFSCRTEIDTSV